MYHLHFTFHSAQIKVSKHHLFVDDTKYKPHMHIRCRLYQILNFHANLWHIMVLSWQWVQNIFGDNSLWWRLYDILKSFKLEIQIQIKTHKIDVHAHALDVQALFPTMIILYYYYCWLFSGPLLSIYRFSINRKSSTSNKNEQNNTTKNS